MATIKKGTLTSAREWWVHLRKEMKRDFWHRERKAQRRAIENADDAKLMIGRHS